jgi:DNA mismatch repair protein MutS
MEHLHECSRSRALFATHYHELTELAKQFDRIDNLTVRVTDWNGDIVFLHEIVAGAADRSYGIQVAKLAGLPASVIARARTLLAEFEAADRLVHAERLVADLPLFAPPAAGPALDSKSLARDAGGEPVSTFPHPELADRLGAKLDAIDPDGLTPREALEALYQLKALRDGKG